MFGSSVVFSIMAWLYPVINAFFLMALGFPCFILLYIELKKLVNARAGAEITRFVRRCRDARVRRLGYRCIILWTFSVSCWVSDRLFCDLWLRINFPYLHGAWHVLIAATSCTLCVLFAYFDAYNEHYDKIPSLKYWPNDDIEFGVPYVMLKYGD